MTLVVSKEVKTGLIDLVEKTSGVSIRECLQCKKCSSGCPVHTISDIGPAEIIRRLQLGAGDELLENDLVWKCVSCETCYSRCPMQIDMAAIMDSIRVIAVQKKTSGAKDRVHLFDKFFLGTVRLFGRTYDIGMLAAYKTGTSTYLQDTGKFPMMLWKRKIALFPSFRGNRKAIRRTFNKIEKNESV